MTTRLYSWDDVGAPSHSGSSVGQILTIIRACLVDGYGTRTPAGWSMPFSDLPNNRAVFLGQSGTGDYFRIDDNVNHEYSNVVGFATMSDIDTGTEIYPTVGSGGSDDVTAYRFLNRDGTTTTYDDWYVIANEEFCYCLFRGSLTYRACFFFGKYDKLNPAVNQPNSAIVGTSYPNSISTSILEYQFFMGSTTYDYIFQRRNKWNDTQRNTRLYMGRDATKYEQPNPLDGKFYFKPLTLYDKESTDYVIWGKMPDLIAMREGGSAAVFQPVGERLSVNGGNYIIAKTSNGYVYGWRYDVDVG